MPSGLLKWIVLCAAVTAVSAAIAFGTLVWLIVNSTRPAVARFVAPSEQAIHISKPGWYAVYYESSSVVNGTRIRAGAAPASLSIGLTHSDGTPVPISMSAGGASYVSGAFEGEQIAGGQIDTPGIYTLAVSTGAAPAGQFAVAVFPSLRPSHALGAVFTSGAASMVFALNFVALLVLLIVQVVLRAQNRARPGPVANR